MAAENFDVLKREAKTLEGYIDQRLSASAPAAAARTAADVEEGFVDPDTKRLREIEESLQKLASVIDRMAAIAADSAGRAYGGIVSVLRMSLTDLRSEYRRQAAAARERREAAALLADMARRKAGKGEEAATDILLRERASLTGSHRAVDDMLQQAAQTREALGRQRGVLGSASSRLSQLAARFPVIGDIMNAVNRRRQYNRIVISTVISLCVCFTLWWLLSAR